MNVIKQLLNEGIVKKMKQLMMEIQNLKNQIAAMKEDAQMKNRLTSTEERHIMENHGCQQDIIADREEQNFKSKLLE